MCTIKHIKYILMWAVLNLNWTLDGVFVLPQNPNILDLSHPFNNQSIHYIGDLAFTIDIKYKGPREVGNHTIWYQTEEVHFSSHLGTHVGGPCYLAKGKWCVTDIPIEYLIDRPAAVVDVTRKVNQNRDYEVNVQDLLEYEAKYEQIPDNGVLVIHTGYGRFYHNLLLYSGTVGYDPRKFHWPGLGVEAARWLVKNRQVVGVGIDTVGIDSGQGVSAGLQTHATLCEQNIYLFANLPETIKKLPRKGATLTLLPMKIEFSGGAPVRVIARLCPGNNWPCLLEEIDN